MVIRNRVRQVREARGLSQTALAARAGVHRNTVVLIETTGRAPEGSVMARLCGALDCELSDLFWSEREETAGVA